MMFDAFGYCPLWTTSTWANGTCRFSGDDCHASEAIYGILDFEFCMFPRGSKTGHDVNNKILGLKVV